MMYNKKPASNEREGGRLAEVTQTLEMPIEEAKGEVFSAYLNLVLAAANIIASTENNDTDMRANEIIDLLISVVPNKDFRDTTRANLREKINKETTSLTTNAEVGRRTKAIYRETLGDITSYMDRYAGGERVNRISFIIPIKEIREIMEKLNPEHFVEHLSDLDKNELKPGVIKPDEFINPVKEEKANATT